METKVCIAVLCFLGVFVIAQAAETIQLSDLAKHSDCFKYANCESKSDEQSLVKCFKDNLSPEQQKEAYNGVNKKTNFDSDNVEDAIQEFCGLDSDEQDEKLGELGEGIADYQSKICPDSDSCKPFGLTLGCALKDIAEVKAEGKC